MRVGALNNLSTPITPIKWGDLILLRWFPIARAGDPIWKIPPRAVNRLLPPPCNLGEDRLHVMLVYNTLGSKGVYDLFISMDPPGIDASDSPGDLRAGRLLWCLVMAAAAWMEKGYIRDDTPPELLVGGTDTKYAQHPTIAFYPLTPTAAEQLFTDEVTKIEPIEPKEV